jgi:hypothetical protein
MKGREKPERITNALLTTTPAFLARFGRAFCGWWSVE